MTYSKIEAFLSIVETGSLTKASELLYISQPAITHRIQSLESELGVELIIRKKGMREVELTEAGKSFVGLARKWRKLWDETRNVKNVKSAEPFKIDALHSLNVFILPEIYRLFLMRNNTAPLSISTVLHSYEAYPLVENGDVDIAFIATPINSRYIDNISLFKERMKMIYSSRKNLPDIVNPEELDVNDEIMIGWSHEFKSWHEYWFGHDLKQKVFLDNISLMQKLVSDIKGWAIVPASMASYIRDDPRIKICDIKDGPPDRVYYMLSLHTDKFREQKELFLEDLRSVLQNNEDIELF